MSYVLSVIHPPVAPAAFGRAVVLDPVAYHATAAKRQARYVLEMEGGVSREESGEFGIKLVLAQHGTPVTHKPTGFTFRIDPADEAPHPCPCCGRLVLPTDHAEAAMDDAYCLGCFTWDSKISGCWPDRTAHTEEP